MPRGEFRPQPEAKLARAPFFEGLNPFLEDNMILMVEPGGAGFVRLGTCRSKEAENFIVQAYYCSIGYCVLSTSLARPGKRPVVLVGDGAFQMTAQDLVPYPLPLSSRYFLAQQWRLHDRAQAA